MREIPGFEDYAITKDGRVWSKPRTTPHGHKRKGRWIKPERMEYGHLRVVLCKNAKCRHRLIHQLILETYVGPCPKGMECRHLDGDPANNNLDNLCWGTKRENQQDRVKHGTDSRGEENGNAKLKEQDIRVIRYLRDVAKFTLDDIAWQFGMSKSCIGRICCRNTWGHVA